ncbi:MAG: dioxygenase, partial [Betaproteobacteria bacterium]|nr:dioxygenase [Betaproteobacteria bacterium]
FALGAAAWGANANVQINYLSREVMFGMLSMDALSLN